MYYNVINKIFVTGINFIVFIFIIFMLMYVMKMNKVKVILKQTPKRKLNNVFLMSHVWNMIMQCLVDLTSYKEAKESIQNNQVHEKLNL